MASNDEYQQRQFHENLSANHKKIYDIILGRLNEDFCKFMAKGHEEHIKRQREWEWNNILDSAYINKANNLKPNINE